MILNFCGPYQFLSNFYDSPVTLEGLVYRNAEAAFQSCKVLEKKDREDFVNLSPPQAKLLGRNVALRPDWDEVKDNFMLQIVTNKFTSNPDLTKKLLETGDELLEEGNWWHDNYWGVCSCKRCQVKNISISQCNHLGKILMQVREHLKLEK